MKAETDGCPNSAVRKAEPPLTPGTRLVLLFYSMDWMWSTHIIEKDNLLDLVSSQSTLTDTPRIMIS